MRKTIFCPMCETTVYADDVHSCYDAKAVRHDRAVQDAREAVVRAAMDYEKWMGKWHDYTVSCGDKPAKQQRALIAAVRHLATLTATEGRRMPRSTQEKVMRTWAESLSSMLADASRLAHDTNTSVRASEQVGRALIHSAEILRRIAEVHVATAQRAEGDGLEADSIATVAMLSLTAAPRGTETEGATDA